MLLGYDYTSRLVLLEDSSGGDVSPHAYVMCSRYADGLRLPRGWMLEDRRTRPPLYALPN